MADKKNRDLLRGTEEKRIENLEQLYKPVNRLSTLFCICTFVLGLILGMTGYLWTRVDAIQNDVSRMVSSNESIKEDVSFIKSCLIKEVFKGMNDSDK
jgi:hypothetical protein